MGKPALKIEPITLQPGIVADLPLDLIDFDPEQPRKDIDQAYIEELAADIKTNGVMQPITVRANPDAPGRYYVVYGECRTRGSRIAKRQTIPALLASDADDMTRLINQVKENHIRRSLNPIELALFLRRLRDDFKVKSNKRIEETLRAHGITNMSESSISNTIRLAELPDWALQATREGKLTAGHGKYLLQAMTSNPVMNTLRDEIMNKSKDFSVRDLQARIFALFIDRHINLMNSDQTPFDYQTQCVKAGCQKMRKISGNETQPGITFCVGDPECHKAKRRAVHEANRKATSNAGEQPPTESSQGGTAGKRPNDKAAKAINYRAMITGALTSAIEARISQDTKALAAVMMLFAVRFDQVTFDSELLERAAAAENIADLRSLLDDGANWEASAAKTITSLLPTLKPWHLMDLATYFNLGIGEVLAATEGDTNELGAEWEAIQHLADEIHSTAVDDMNRYKAEEDAEATANA